MQCSPKKQKTCWFRAFGFDILNKILRLLPPISQMAMLRAYPPLRQRLNGYSVYQHVLKACSLKYAEMHLHTKNIILEHIHARHFCIQMLKFDGVVSGSLLLACLTDDKHWSPNDLDLFSNQSGGTGSTAAYLKKYDVVSPFITSMGCADDIQYICLDPIVTPEDFVRDHFDLDFLRNYITIHRLVVHDPVAILKRKATFDAVNHCTPTSYSSNYVQTMRDKVRRILKYRSRGYSISILPLDKERCIRRFEQIVEDFEIHKPVAQRRNIASVASSWFQQWKNHCYNLMVHNVRTLVIKDEKSLNYGDYFCVMLDVHKRKRDGSLVYHMYNNIDEDCDCENPKGANTKYVSIPEAVYTDLDNWE